MAKRYEVEWLDDIRISILRGKKRKELFFYIKSMGQFHERIFNESIQNLKSINMLDINVIRGWSKSMKKLFEALSEKEFIVEGPTVYYRDGNVAIDDIRRVLAFRHKGKFKGTYHLHKSEKLLVHRGNLKVQKTYQNVEFLPKQKHFQNQVFQDWKRELSVYYSEWELDDVMLLLFAMQLFPKKDVLSWAKDLYQERADYLIHLMPKDIQLFIFLSIFQTSKD